MSVPTPQKTLDMVSTWFSIWDRAKAPISGRLANSRGRCPLGISRIVVDTRLAEDGACEYARRAGADDQPLRFCSIHIIGGRSTSSSRHVFRNDGWISRNVLLQEGQDSFDSQVSHASRTAPFNHCNCFSLIINRLGGAVLCGQENNCPKTEPEPTAKASHFYPPRPPI